MWSSGRRVLQDVLMLPAAVRSFSLSAAQSTVVVERWWSVPLSKVGSPPRLYPRRHRVYRLVENTTQNPTKMKLILTEAVQGIGRRGDTVIVKKNIGRNRLLSKGLAVYPTAENEHRFAEERRILREGKVEDRIQTHSALKTLEFLKSNKLNINQMPSEEFEVTKEVICRQFRKKLGVIVPPQAINFPFESVKDVGDYWCEIAINGMNQTRLPVSVVPYEDVSARYKRQLKQQMNAEAAGDVEEAAAADAEEAAANAETAVAEAAADAETAASVDAETAAAVDAETAAAADAETAAAVSDAVLKSASAKDSESQVSEASVSAGSEDTAASTQKSDDTTPRPVDGPKKD